MNGMHHWLVWHSPICMGLALFFVVVMVFVGYAMIIKNGDKPMSRKRLYKLTMKQKMLVHDYLDSAESANPITPNILAELEKQEKYRKLAVEQKKSVDRFYDNPD